MTDNVNWEGNVRRAALQKGIWGVAQQPQFEPVE